MAKKPLQKALAKGHPCTGYECDYKDEDGNCTTNPYECPVED